MRSRLRPHPGTARSRPASWLGRLLLLFVVAFASSGSAQSMQVPTNVQAELLVKVAGFDRNYKARAGAKAIILLAAAPGDAGSERAVLEMKSALARVPTIADLPHEEQIVKSSSAAVIAAAARERKAAIVYLGPGYAGQTAALRDAFSSLNVLTVGGVPDYVPSGAVVLGFDLVSGRPKLLVHIQQARKQRVAFPASLLNLMKIYP